MRIARTGIENDDPILDRQRFQRGARHHSRCSMPLSCLADALPFCKDRHHFRR
jgi:hypothetical protein